MKKFFYMSAVLFCLCGCGRSPETDGEVIAEHLSAEQLFEVTMARQLQNSPAIGSYYEQAFEQFCTKCNVPLRKPVLALLKQGFAATEYSVAYKVLDEDTGSESPVVYWIEYRVDAGDRTPVSYLAVFQFKVFFGPEGAGVIEAGGFEEINGRRIFFKEPAQMIECIGMISRGLDRMPALSDAGTKANRGAE